jgi:acyl transferase domain-containing protein
MNESDAQTAPPGDRRQLLEQALHQVRRMRARLEAVERAASEPIAIVGMSCRLPGGADGVDAYWRLLRDGIDAIGPMPGGRWNQDDFLGMTGDPAAGVGSAFAGSLGDIDSFDAEFFGLQPEEATRLDPQHRLLLELAWEAIEHGGQTLEALRAARTGVFVGVYNSDYLLLQLARQAGVDVFTASGSAHSLAANRLSYTFDLRGPSVAIDTACSSSLVAVHLACRSLRARESDVALAGGVNLILSPLSTVLTARVLPMAPDGRCKTFDDRADGIVRAEGCGVVVLKRLSDAVRDGDPIAAVVRGSAVNHDGRTNGLTAPSSLSQQAVIAQALEDARIDPSQVSLIEAHGTGTPLGDAIELEALHAIYDAGGGARRPCAVGSVKTNMGHLEAAAGIAAFIKVALALHHRAIPPHLHVRSRHALLRQAHSRFFVPGAVQPWPSAGEPRVASVSSFGFGGTNAHVVLQEPPAPEPLSSEEAETRFVLPVSARSHGALAAAVLDMQSFLAATDHPVEAICYTAAVRRTHHRFRCAVVGNSRAALVEHLEARHVQLAVGRAATRSGGPSRQLAFVFGRTSAQQRKALLESLDRHPIAVSRLQDCDAKVHDRTGARLSDIDVVSSFAIQVAVADVLRSLGASPAAVAGHGEGEVAAALINGSIDLDSAIGQLLDNENGRHGAHSQDSIGDLIRTGHTVVTIGDDRDAASGPLSVCRSGLHDVAASLYELGIAVDWRVWYPKPRRPVVLPAYPWQRRRYWIEPQPPSTTRQRTASPSTAGVPAASVTVDALIVYITERVVEALRSLGETIDAIDPDRPLRDLDLDSLTVVDLRNQAERDLQLTIPLRLLIDGPSIRTIASTLAPAPEAQAAASSATAISAAEATGVLRRFESLSDDDVEEMLGRLGHDGAAEIG